MKKNLLRSALLTVLMVFSAMTAWAAGYTRTLTEELEVAGYTLKAFYDFQNNNPEVLPTEGDLRYRAYEKGGYWGLHNFGRGTRSNSVAIPVAKDDIVILQVYSDSQTTSCSGTKNMALSSSLTPYVVFEISEDAENITLGCSRGGGFVAALIMEKDASAATAAYTINYLLNGAGEPVKTVSGETVVGQSVVTEASFFANEVKYFRADGQPESVEIAASGNNFNIDVRKAATFNYAVVSSLGGNIATGTGLEGETITMGYPRYALVDGKFYEAGKNNNEYRTKIALTADNASTTINYTEKEGVNVAFYAEGENIEGMNVSTNGNIPVRASNAQAGVSAEDVTITTLSAGKYILHVGTFTSKSSTQTIYIGYGETQLAFTSATNLNEAASEEFELTAATEIKYFGTASSTDAQLDYLWIEKTDVEQPVTTVYSIAGSLESLFGAVWDPTATATEMALNTESGLYEWTKSDVTLEAGDIEFKVVVNHSWDEAYPPQNYKLNITAAGEYTVLITFNAETKEVKATATKKAPVLNTYTATFTTNAGWEKVYAYAWSGDGESATKFLGDWPGTELTAADGVYTATIEAEAAPEKIIFNNGNSGEGNQTADLAFENGKAYTYELSALAINTALVAGATVENPVAAPFVVNGTFDNNTDGWTSTGEFQNRGTATNQAGAFTGKFWENWNPSAKENKMYQVIENIPNGVYLLKIAAFVNTLANPTNESQFVFANSDKVYLTTGEPTMYEVYTKVEANTMEIGLEQITATANWMGIDNISLTYFGADATIEAAKNGAFLKEVTETLAAKTSAKTKNALQAAYDAFVAESTNETKAALEAALASAKASANSYAVLEAGVLPDNSLAGWTCTNTNTFHINTWSVEGNSDGTGMVTPFIENWCDKNNGYLGTGEIYYSLPGLDPGIYQFSALIRAYSESGNEPTGASLFAGDREKEFATGKNFEFNGMKGIYDTYAMAAEVGEDGVFKFGIKIAEERNFNWMAFKNCKVSYVGGAIDAAAVAELAATMPEDKMNAEVKAAAEAAIATATATPNLDNYEAAAKAIAATQTSVAAYKNAKAAIDAAKAEMASTNVYTQEAYDAYKAGYTEKETAYEAGSLTDAEANAVENPTTVTGWHANVLVDNFLLSAWDTNPDFQDAPYYINTWSTEGGNDGSNFTVPFFEYWTGDGNSLGEKTLTATMNDLEEGDYDVTAWVRVRMKNGAEAPATGITFQANDGEAVNASDGAQIGGSQFYLKEVKATGTVAEDGVLKIKFIVAADNNISWLSFKNVKFQKQVPVPYYIVGNMTDWAVNESYRMTRNEAAEGEEYMFTMDLTTTSQFKVVKVDGENLTWYPDGMGNNYGENGEITADESYTIYFRPNADGGDDWFYNVIYAVKRTTDIVNTFKAPATSDTIYTLSGQKVEKAVKGLYIINGKKVVVK